MNYLKKVSSLTFIIAICISIIGTVFPKPLFAASQWISSQDAITQGITKAPVEVLQIQMTYTHDSFTINAVQIHKGFVPKQDEFAKDYVLIAKDGIGKELYRKLFSVNLKVYSLPPEPGTIDRKESTKTFSSMRLSEIIPWNSNYKTIEVQDQQGRVLTTFDSSKFIRKNNTVSFGAKRGRDFAKSNASLPTNDNVLAATAGETLDITFIGDNYTASEMPKFHEDVLRFSNKLSEFAPFTQYLDKIIFYYVDNTSDLGCTYSGRTIVCNSFLVYLTVQLSGAPYDRVAVIVNDPTYGGAAVGELAAMYNGESGPAGFVHEFGHAFSRLADEYLANVSSESTDRNCYTGIPPNPAWEGIPINGYFLECNFPNYYRSTPDSIMRTLAAEYFNPVSMYYLKTSLDYYTGVVTSPTPTIVPSTSTPTIIVKPGDANGDNKVDGLDFVAWLNHYNQTTTNGPSFGDFNRDGKVDGIDFTIWLNNYGK